MSALKSQLTSAMTRVAILGAESSGKTILAEALAARYHTVWVPEYLREFVEIHQRAPRAEEQILIATIQLQREKEAAQRAKDWLFCDTSPLMTAIYSRHYFKHAEAALEELEQAHTYDFTLVTAPDFPWSADGLQRESAAVRQHIHEKLLGILDEREIPFMLLEGSLEQRVEQVQFALSFLFE
jgi:NadR type nicotinamide-nucleotide adenylyltransferase